MIAADGNQQNGVEVVNQEIGSDLEAVEGHITEIKWENIQLRKQNGSFQEHIL